MNAGFNGFGDFSSSSGSALNEGFSALYRAVVPVLSAASQPVGENYSLVRQSAQEMEKSCESQNGDSLGGVSSRVTMTTDAP